MKGSCLSFVLLLMSWYADANLAWTLSREKDGIKIFTAKVDNSAVKAVKVECMVNAKPFALLALLLDVNHNYEWVYKIKSSKLLKTISDRELIYYAVIATPWPFTNRDMIAHLKVSRTSDKVIEIASQAEPGYIPEKCDHTRIKASNSHWTITTAGENLLKVEYQIQFNPGGNIPAWLINMFITEGPYETFKKLKEQVSAPAYQRMQFNL